MTSALKLFPEQTAGSQLGVGNIFRASVSFASFENLLDGIMLLVKGSPVCGSIGMHGRSFVRLVEHAAVPNAGSPEPEKSPVSVVGSGRLACRISPL